MTPKTFYTQLSAVSGLVGLLLILLHLHEKIAPHQSFSWISWGFFILFCAVLFWLSSKTSQSENKALFGQVFLLSIFFKMLLCILLIIFYALLGQPENKLFILPFGLIYIAFTIFEVYFVTKLAKT